MVALLLPFSAVAKLLDVSYFTLDNGLEVAVIENHKAPVVLQMLYYKTGSINDPKGKNGIAHLLEHLMFRGTKRVKDQMFSHLTDKYGAENNAYTTYNETGYYEFSDITKLELMMALEADRMQNLVISDEAFLKERDVVLEERMQRFETKAAPLFYETLNKLLWQDSARAQPVSGSAEDIKGLKKEDAEDFYKRWYRPDNALLVLSGDIKPKEAKMLVEKYYGGISVKEKLMVAQNQVLPPRQTDMFIKAKLVGVEQSRFVNYIRIEPNALNNKDVLALEILAEYFAGDDTAFLYDALVYQSKKLLGIDVGIAYDKDTGGVFSFYATPADERAEASDIWKWIERAVEDGIAAFDADKLEKIKHQILSDTVYLQENPQDAARFVGGMLLASYRVEEIENYDEIIRAVEVKDVMDAWHKVLESQVKIKGYLERAEQ